MSSPPPSATLPPLLPPPPPLLRDNMVKFSKELEAQLIPEWKDAFVNYWQLKKHVKKIKLSRIPKHVSKTNYDFGRSIFDPIRVLASRIAGGTNNGGDNPEIIQVHIEILFFFFWFFLWWLFPIFQAMFWRNSPKDGRKCETLVCFKRNILTIIEDNALTLLHSSPSKMKPVLKWSKFLFYFSLKFLFPVSFNFIEWNACSFFLFYSSFLLSFAVRSWWLLECQKSSRDLEGSSNVCYIIKSRFWVFFVFLFFCFPLYLCVKAGNLFVATLHHGKVVKRRNKFNNPKRTRTNESRTWGGGRY